MAQASEACPQAPEPSQYGWFPLTPRAQSALRTPAAAPLAPRYTTGFSRTVARSAEVFVARNSVMR